MQGMTARRRAATKVFDSREGAGKGRRRREDRSVVGLRPRRAGAKGEGSRGEAASCIGAAGYPPPSRLHSPGRKGAARRAEKTSAPPSFLRASA